MHDHHRRSRSSLLTRGPLLCALIIFVASCSSSKASSDTTAAPAPVATEAAPVATDAPTDATSTTVTAAATTDSVLLTGLSNGDRACYVTVKGADGTEQDLLGSFDLCEGGQHDATALIGQQVSYRTQPDKVSAASCQGAPDCSETEDVDLVVEITPTNASGAAPGTVAPSDTLPAGITGLPLDSPSATAIALLGAPDSKGPVEDEEATGESVSTWTWPAKGVTAKMGAATPTGDQVVRALTITAPSTLRTEDGIGIGASKDAVEAAYSGRINPEESGDDTIIVGSPFGGIIFTIADGKVASIFVGAAAE